MRGNGLAARSGALGMALLLVVVATTAAAEPDETIYRDAEPPLPATLVDGLFAAEASAICVRASASPLGIRVAFPARSSRSRVRRDR